MHKNITRKLCCYLCVTLALLASVTLFISQSWYNWISWTNASMPSNKYTQNAQCFLHLLITERFWGYHLELCIFCRCWLPKLRNNFIEGLLMKYSVLCGVSGHHDGDNIVQRLMDHHLSKRIPPTEKKCKHTIQCIVCSKHKKRRKTILMSWPWCCSVHWWVFRSLLYTKKLPR
jgi:hypothetical protein